MVAKGVSIIKDRTPAQAVSRRPSECAIGVSAAPPGETHSHRRRITSERSRQTRFSQGARRRRRRRRRAGAGRSRARSTRAGAGAAGPRSALPRVVRARAGGSEAARAARTPTSASRATASQSLTSAQRPDRDARRLRGGGGFGGRGGGGTTETYGFGVRVIHSGVWGFASSPLVTPEEIKRVAGVATDVARASAIAKKRDVRLAPVERTTSSGRCRSRRTRGRCRSRRRSSCCAASPRRCRRTRRCCSRSRRPASSTSGSPRDQRRLVHRAGLPLHATATRRRDGAHRAPRSRRATTSGWPAPATSSSSKCDLPGQAERDRRRSGRALDGEAGRARGSRIWS